MKNLKTTLGRVLPILVVAMAPNAFAETVGSNPSWDITKMEAPAGDEEGVEGPVYFTMTPDDGRPAITIDSASATKILNGEIQPESIYSRTQSNRNAKGAAKAKTSGGWLQTAEPIYSTAIKDDQPDGYNPYEAAPGEAKAGSKEAFSGTPSAITGGGVGSSSPYGNNMGMSGASNPMANNVVMADDSAASGGGDSGSRELASENAANLGDIHNPLAPPQTALGVMQAKAGEFNSMNVAPVPTPAPTPAPVTTCEQAKAAKTIKTGTRTVTFASTVGQYCQWGQNNNLNMTSGKHAARREQTEPLEMPAGAVLCDMKITSDGGTLRYDDAFFLTFNDYVIASNANPAVNRMDKETMQAGGKSVSMYKYDWLKFRGTSTDESNYCAGSGLSNSSCSWPKTEQNGAFKLSYNSDLIRKINEKAAADQQELSFIVTGDNDNSSDCQHTEVKLNVAIEFFMPGNAPVPQSTATNTSTNTHTPTATQTKTSTSTSTKSTTSSLIERLRSGTTTTRPSNTQHR